MEGCCFVDSTPLDHTPAQPCIITTAALRAAGGRVTEQEAGECLTIGVGEVDLGHGHGAGDGGPGAGYQLRRGCRRWTGPWAPVPPPPQAARMDRLGGQYRAGGAGSGAGGAGKGGGKFISVGWLKMSLTSQAAYQPKTMKSTTCTVASGRGCRCLPTPLLALALKFPEIRHLRCRRCRHPRP